MNDVKGKRESKEELILKNEREGVRRKRRNRRGKEEI